MQTEPVWTVGSITAVTTAVLALLVAAGLPIGDDLAKAILGLIAVAAPLVMAAVTRGRVYAPATVRNLTGSELPRG